MNQLPLLLQGMRLDCTNGKQIKVAGGYLFSGYGLQNNGHTIGIIDVLDNNIWISSNLESTRKLIVSFASAIWLKRMQDGSEFKESYSLLTW